MVIFRKIQNRRGRISLLIGLFLLLALASFSRTTWAMRQLPPCAPSPLPPTVHPALNRPN